MPCSLCGSESAANVVGGTLRRRRSRPALGAACVLYPSPHRLGALVELSSAGGVSVFFATDSEALARPCGGPPPRCTLFGHGRPADLAAPRLVGFVMITMREITKDHQWAPVGGIGPALSSALTRKLQLMRSRHREFGF